jgi:hypothetical protein
MKLWVTKYALTRGLFQAEFEEYVASNGRKYWSGAPGYRNLFFRAGGSEAIESLDEAKKIASEMARKKIASLERQIAKLRKLAAEPKMAK